MLNLIQALGTSPNGATFLTIVASIYRVGLQCMTSTLEVDPANVLPPDLTIFSRTFNADFAN